MRGKLVAARSPASMAKCLDAVGRQITRTDCPKERAISAVLSVQPLATTIISRPGTGPVGASCLSNPPMTRFSLCAGITIVVTTEQYKVRRLSHLDFNESRLGQNWIAIRSGNHGARLMAGEWCNNHIAPLNIVSHCNNWDRSNFSLARSINLALSVRER